jgi:hypothetical protein
MQDREATMNLLTSRVVLLVALAGCGSSHNTSDGSIADSGDPDAQGMPPPPALGAQIDRAGRPAISTMLIGTFALPADKQAQQDAYNRAADPATWKTTMLRTNVTIEAELQANLAAFDGIDNPPFPMASTVCGNALDYTKPLTPASYRGGADLFADDQLYIDTTMATCKVFLALEIEQGGFGRFSHTECGGRTLSHDAFDVIYSVLAAGVVDGLDQAGSFSPRIHGSLTAHTDITTAFPFLGPPHP